MESEDDRISALPDCLLHEILSSLPSTKEAIQTGTLSKRWEHLWTWVHTLIFTPSTTCFQFDKSKSDIASLVDKTLSQCRQLKLKKFVLQESFHTGFESQINNWIRYAISCDVEELTLEFCEKEAEFMLDQLLFVNSCVTDMRLARCKLKPTGAISWENLSTLCLFHVNVDQNLIVNILSGSPLLETLAFEGCTWHIITSESETETDIIKMSTPSLSLTQCCLRSKLKRFEILNGFHIQFQSRINNWILNAIRCNVKEVMLLFWNTSYNYELMLDQIFFTSSCFTELKLNGCMLNPVGAISWTSLKSLYISSSLSLHDNLFENILSGSPVLETLVLANCYGYKRLNMTSVSLKTLVLIGYEDRDRDRKSKDDIIEIIAPYILSLAIEGTFLCKKVLLNVSSVVQAYLNYSCTNFDYLETTPKEEDQVMLKGFLMNLCHVKELELGCLSSKVLSCLEANGFVSPSNVKLTGRM